MTATIDFSNESRTWIVIAMGGEFRFRTLNQVLDFTQSMPTRWNNRAVVARYR